MGWSALDCSRNLSIAMLVVEPHTLRLKAICGVVGTLLLLIHHLLHSYIRNFIRQVSHALLLRTVITTFRNKPEGRKTALAGASIFTSELLELMTWTILLPFMIRLIL